MNYILTNEQLEHISDKCNEVGGLELQSLNKINGEWCFYFTSTRGDRIIEYTKRKNNE